MNIDILKAKNKKEMDKIYEELLSNKFKIHSSSENFILMKRRRYGNYYVHILCLLIALFAFYPLILVNVVYFAYSFLWKSPHVLITTETKDDNGNPLEFSTMDIVLEKANALF